MVLDVREVGYDYPEQQLLQGVKFTLQAGELLHIRGSNGSGKTTLLKLLAGLLQPSRGAIYYQDGAIANNLTPYQQVICYIGHRPGISQLLTVRENCQFELHQVNQTFSLEKLMTTFSLQGFEDVPCGLLSAGQQRRVGLLRLLVTQAKLWLLDEPIVSLDKASIDVFMQLVQQHLMRGGMVVLTSHQSLPGINSNCQEYCL